MFNSGDSTTSHHQTAAIYLLWLLTIVWFNSSFTFHFICSWSRITSSGSGVDNDQWVHICNSIFALNIAINAKSCIVSAPAFPTVVVEEEGVTAWRPSTEPPWRRSAADCVLTTWNKTLVSFCDGESHYPANLTVVNKRRNEIMSWIKISEAHNQTHTHGKLKRIVTPSRPQEVLPHLLVFGERFISGDGWHLGWCDC